METMKRIVAIQPAGTEIALDSSNMSYVNVGTQERVLSFLGGAALTALAGMMAKSGVKRELYNWLALPAGIYLMKRGLTGYCELSNLGGRNSADSGEMVPVELRTSFILEQPRKEVYSRWRKLENLPEYLPHLQAVTPLEGKRSQWKATLPGGIGTFQWVAEIVEDRKNEKISWQSVEGSDIGNTGEVFFVNAPDGKGTEVQVTIQYIPPAGPLGKKVATRLTHTFENYLQKELEGFRLNEKL